MVSRFWMVIFQLDSEIHNVLITPSPELVLLNIGIDTVPPTLNCHIIHILLAARLVIVHHWQTFDPLTRAEVNYFGTQSWYI